MGLHRQYHSKRRVKRYMSRLVERVFCLDADFMASHGFFRGGRGTEWEYSCRTIADGSLGSLQCSLVDSEHRDEHKVLLESQELLLDGNVEIRVVYMWNILVRWRPRFICPRCHRRVATLFIPLWALRIACRRCNNLVYWSQYRGRRRIGEFAYERSKPLYEMHKTVRLIYQEE